MDQITDRLYIGDIQQAGRHQLYNQNNIEAVIQLTSNQPEKGYPQDVDTYQYTIKDGPENELSSLKQAVNQTISLLESGNRIVIHCNVGTSRSVAVGAAATAIYYEMSFEQVIERIRQKRRVQIHPKVLQNAKTVVNTS
jgi:protein-tyrosine phosphatase